MASILKLPKQFIASIERIFCTFLWSSRDNKSFTWISWKKACMPVEDGGLGIRPLELISDSLQGKLAWKVITSDSLWANYMRSKYGDPLLPNSRGQSWSSRIWKSISKHLDIMLPHMHCIVGNGSSNFWYSNWSSQQLPRPPLYTEEYTIKQVLHTPYASLDVFQVLPPSIKRELQSIIITDQPDLMVWKPVSSGTFSSCSYGHILRPTLHNFPWHKVIWNKNIPLNIAANAWRVWHRGFPTDERIRRMQICFPSKCYCCFQPQEETFLHLFLHSDLARGLWQPLEELLHLNSAAKHTIPALFEGWLHGISASNQSGFLRAAAFMCSLKQIWFYRNKIKHEGARLEPFKALKEVLSYLATLHHRFQPSSFSTSCTHDIIAAAGIQIKLPPPKLIRWIKWQPPKLGLKLNTDGSMVEGVITGGGIIRDHKGNMILAYHQGFGLGTNLEAEAHALLVGLQLCTQHSLSIAEIEVDSQPLADLVAGSKEGPWHAIYIIRSIKQLITSLGLVVNHVLREGNSVADALATTAHNTYTRILYLSEEFLPPPARAAVDRDKKGKATLRIG